MVDRACLLFLPALLLRDSQDAGQDAVAPMIVAQPPANGSEGGAARNRPAMGKIPGPAHVFPFPREGALSGCAASYPYEFRFFPP